MRYKWYDYQLRFWKMATSIDGSKVRGGHIMRRRAPNGNWQYRAPTEEESQLYEDTGRW
jgi:hypothetical protein